jgi:hypothetical protein
MKTLTNFIVYIYILVIFASCQGERFRSDKNNKLTRKQKVACDFHAKQAIELTQENIEKRDQKEKTSRKKLEKQQAVLNELNKPNRAKRYQKHTGNFKFY